MFWFETERALRFDAGQYAELTVPHQNADSRGATRWMSIASSPSEPLIGIVTNFPARNPSSYKRALLELQPGDEVQVGEPIGDFVLPKDASIPLALVAGGIGIAPARSMIAWLASKHQHRDIQLIYSAGAPQEFAFSDVLQAYPLQMIRLATKAPGASWRGLTGRLTAPRVLELVGDIAGKLIFLSGPQSLIEPLFNDLLRLGVPRSQLVLDYFPGY